MDEVEPESRRTGRYAPRASAQAGAEPADWLSSFLESVLGDGRTGLRDHLDLNLGQLEEPTLEPTLFTLLGVSSECRMLMGISWVSAGDLQACRAEWGDPCARVDLRRGTPSPLAWDIWSMPAQTLILETVAGDSLVLMEQNPRWILYTDPGEVMPMLFISSQRCPNHQ